MTTKVYIKTAGSWVETTSYVHSLEFHDNGQSALDKIKVAFKRNILTTNETPDYQKEIKLEIDSNDIFAGLIEKPLGDFPLHTVMAYSYGTELLDKFVNQAFENTTPEGIAKEIIEDGTSLTYASTVPTGITIDRILFRDKKKSEVLGILGDLVGWGISTDVDKNAFFGPIGAVSSGLTLTVGSNVINKPKWDFNPDWIISKVIIEGDKQEFKTTQTFSSGTFVNLTYEPSGGVVVTEATLELDPTVEGSVSGDYTVTPEKKTIEFGSARTTISVDYNYKVPIRIEQEAQTVNSSKEYKIKNKSIKSFAEARKKGRDFLSVRSEAKKGTKLVIQGFDENLKSNNIIRVIDSTETDSSGDGINEELIMNKILYKYPQDQTTVTVGTNEFLIYDLLNDYDAKIRELQQEDTNADLVQIYKIADNPVTVDQSTRVTGYKRTINDSWIWGTAVWGTDKWGDRREGDNFESYAGDEIEQIDLTNLEGLYRLNNDATDESDNSNDGTESIVSYVTGKVGQAGSFNGSNSKIDLGSSIVLTGTFTMSAWFYGKSHNSRPGIMGDQDSLSDGRISYLTSGSQIEIRTGVSSTTVYLSSPSPDTTWYNLVITRSVGNVIKIYRDSVDVTVGTPTAAGDLNINRIGDNPDDSGYAAWDGWIDSFYYFSRLLSQSEIDALYNSGDGREAAEARKISDHWDITGTGTVISGTFSLGDGSVGTYLGRDTGSYKTSNFKMVLDYAKDSSTLLTTKFRAVDADNYYKLELDHTNNKLNLKEVISGTTATLASDTFTFTTSNVITLVCDDTSVRVRSPTKWIVDSTGTSTSSGEIALLSEGGTFKCNKVEIYTGV